MHAYFSNSFFTREAVDLSYIDKDILIILDCTNIPARAREDLFMASRDRLRDKAEKDKLEKALESYLHDHVGLHDLAKQRREEEISSATLDDKPYKNIKKNDYRYSNYIRYFL